MRDDAKIRPVTYGLALYFLLSPLDALSIGAVGSFMKIAAFIPLGLMLLDLRVLRLRTNSLLGLQLCFWFLAMVSIFYSVYPDRTFDADKSLTLNLMLVLMLGVLVPYHSRELELLQKAMLWGCWIQIALTLIFSDFSAAGRLTLRFGDSVQDQNNNNTFFLYAFSFHLYRLLCHRERRHIVPALVIIAMVLSSGSRGGLLAFALTFFFHICLYFRNSRHGLRSILIIALLLAAAWIAFDLILARMPEIVAERFSLESLREKGTTGRGRIWAYFWNVFKDSSIPRMLFGHGYGTPILINEMNHKVAHNLYLDNLISLGIAGMLLQIASQGAVLWIFLKKKKYALLGAYIGMIGMCMSLSLTASKPLWNMILIALAMDCNPAGERSAN